MSARGSIQSLMAGRGPVALGARQRFSTTARSANFRFPPAQANAKSNTNTNTNCRKDQNQPVQRPNQRHRNIDSKPSTSTIEQNNQLRSLLVSGGTAAPSAPGTAAQQMRASEEDASRAELSAAYMRQMPRHFRSGDVYAPRDLHPAEVSQYRRVPQPGKLNRHMDDVDIVGLNPLDNYKNFTMISEWMTSFGRIRRRSDTALRTVNQRKIAKAVRRAIGIGIHPSVHRHPEVLRFVDAKDGGFRQTQLQWEKELDREVGGAVPFSMK